MENKFNGNKLFFMHRGIVWEMFPIRVTQHISYAGKVSVIEYIFDLSKEQNGKDMFTLTNNLVFGTKEELINSLKL